MGDIVDDSQGLARPKAASVLRRGEHSNYVEVQRNVQLNPYLVRVASIAWPRGANSGSGGLSVRA